MTAFTASVTGKASASATWGGAAGPAANADTFVVNSGVDVEWDIDLTGLSTGLGASTINGTLHASRTAGNYGVKVQATLTVSTTGTLDASDGSGGEYPATCTFQITSGSSITLVTVAGSGVVTLRGKTPTHVLCKTTQADNSGQAVLHVDTDLTGAGDSTWWALNGLVRVDNVNKIQQSEQYTISSVTSTTITLTGNLSNSKISGTYVILVSRNVTLLQTGAQTGTGVSGGTGEVIGCAVRNFSTGLNASTSALVSGTVSGCTNGLSSYTSASISGTVSGCSNGLSSSTSASIGGTVSGCSNGLNVCTSASISGTVSGCSNGLNSCPNASIGGTVSGCTSGLSSCESALVSGTVSGCTSGLSVCNVMLLSATLSANTQDMSNQMTGEAYNTSFSSATDYNNPTAFRQLWDYIESINNGNVSGAFKSWCFGGNVISVASPVYDSSRVRSYKHSPVSANAYAFRQQTILVPAGGTVYVRFFVQADTAMAYLPRLWIFSAGKEPFSSGSADAETTMPVSYSLNTWYALTASFTNTANSPQPYIVRTLAKNASGNVYFDPIVRVSGLMQPANMEGLMVA